MNVTAPIWHLRTRCPICDQGSTLTLVACPTCSAIAVICAEEGSAFVNPNALTRDDAIDQDDTRCPACATSPLRDFVDATSAQIQAAQIPIADYE